MSLLQCVMLGQWGGDGRRSWAFLFVFDGDVRKGVVDCLGSFVCMMRGKLVDYLWYCDGGWRGG